MSNSGRISLCALLELAERERIVLAQELLDSVANDIDVSSLSAGERDDIDRRFGEYLRDPDAHSEWADFKAKLRR